MYLGKCPFVHISELCTDSKRTPREQRATDQDSHPPHASWTIAEAPLERAAADTLTILDCCCASNAMKAIERSGRSYLLMAATGKDLTTPKPGPRSYTSALINSLRKLLDNEQLPFNPYDLNQEIIRHRSFDTSSQVFNRRPNPTTTPDITC